ncbi:MAG: cation diffusion facilitator family transporter [Anaerolineales bacterium]|jgi:cation diffusion facilitator family transporter
MAAELEDKPITVYAAIGANTLVALSKFVVAAITHSSAMLSEGIHSLADSGNQGLLLLGIHLAKRPPDDVHPFGYGKEIYFWSLIVAIILFGVGGGVSLYEGVNHLIRPTEIEDVVGNYIVLALAAVFESISFLVALRELRKTMPTQNIFSAVHTSKDPKLFLVLFEDTAALAGLLVAFLGIFIGQQLSLPALDAVASLIIAVILMTMAGILAYESRELLLGEAADPEIVSSIRQIVSGDDAILDVHRPMTMHLGPDDVLLNMKLTFREDLTSGQIARAIDRIESKIGSRYPRIKRIYLEAETFKQE